jgi:hypothetical protein
VLAGARLLLHVLPLLLLQLLLLMLRPFLPLPLAAHSPLLPPALLLLLVLPGRIPCCR